MLSKEFLSYFKPVYDKINTVEDPAAETEEKQSDAEEEEVEDDVDQKIACIDPTTLGENAVQWLE